jgi:hypothetical protein
MIGIILLLMHLCSLRSLGEPYFDPIGPFHPRRFAALFKASDMRDPGPDAA